MPSQSCIMKQLFLILSLFPLRLLAGDSYLTKLKLWFDTPCQTFEQSLPIGNGKLGAMVGGSIASDTVSLFDLSTNRLFGNLVVETNNGETSGYRRQLDIARSLCSTDYVVNGNKISREYFASVPDNLVGLRIRTDSVNREQKLDVTLKLLSADSDNDFCMQLVVKHNGREEACSGNNMRITDATEVLVYLLHEKDSDALDLAKMRLEYKDFAKVRFNHISYYRRQFEPLVEDLAIPDIPADKPTNILVSECDDGDNANREYVEILRRLYADYLRISGLYNLTQKFAL